MGRENPSRGTRNLWEQWQKELAKDKLPPKETEKTATLDELDELMYGDLDEEDFFSIKVRESINNTKNKKTSG